MKGPNRSHAFTLPEAVTGMALLLILVVIGASATFQIRQQAGVTRCVANLRSIGVGFRQWRMEHNDAWPNNYNLRPGRILFDSGIVHFPEIMQCPAAASLPPGKGGGWDDTVASGKTAFDLRFRGHLVSYGMFRPAWVSEGLSGYATSYRHFLGRESNVPYLLDSNAWKTAGAGDNTGLGLVSYRHRDHANVLFLDGHVELLTKQRLLAISTP